MMKWGTCTTSNIDSTSSRCVFKTSKMKPPKMYFGGLDKTHDEM